MTIDAARDARVGSGRELFASLMVSAPVSFALLRRATASGPMVELLTGEVTELSALHEIPLPQAGEQTATEVLTIIPFRQITERGYACNDDHEPILALSVDNRAEIPLDEAIDLLPDVEAGLTGGRFDLADDEYEAVVRKIIDDEISAGEGSNFVIKRSFEAILPHYRPEVAMAIFRRLLAMESNAYWTFLVHTRERTFIGASPEQHVQVVDGVARMNPISGTYRYPASGADLAGVLEFLADQKETDELFMVVDEELKMLARVCDQGARVSGPYLRGMARLAHTEYVLAGDSSMGVVDVLRETMFAPTIVGSPLENACRVIARHELGGRGYYAGVLALIGRDDAGLSTMDSVVLIRTAEVRHDGRMRVDVGATLVRNSQPAAEVTETWTKVSALLAATGLTLPARPAPSVSTPSVGNDPTVLTALARRNDSLSSFWLDRHASPPPTASALTARSIRVLIVDAEDMFTDMLGHQISWLGLDCTVRSWKSVRTADVARFDCVLLGPGPGDPRNLADPRIARLRELAGYAIRGGVPLVAECLSHQILCDLLGLALLRRDRPNQGTQHRICLFGQAEPVGFYNSYAARHTSDWLVGAPLASDAIEVCRDQQTGEVHALRGARFVSTQFHLESVLTQRGTEILADLMAWVVGEPSGAD